MKKLKTTYVISLLIIFSLSLTMLSCDRKGSLKTSKNPVIEITEYSGISKPEGVADSTFFHNIGDHINPTLYDSIFQQTIYWNAYDEDGVVKSFAYRIGTWDSVNSEWQYDKAYGIEIDKSEKNYGWVLHRQPNGDSLIWTSPDQRFPRATVYFPSQDTSDFRNNFGKFEVKCKDDQGNISNVDTKYFCTYSEIPTTYITTSQGNIDSCRVGTAINFEFSVQDPDPYGYGDEAAYYKYRLARVPRIGSREDTLGKGFSGYEFSVGEEILGFVNGDSTWKSTKGTETPSKLFLQMPANDINELSQLQVKAVDKAGVEDPGYATSTFFVRDYFKPETRPFMDNSQEFLNVLPNVYVLGKNHYLGYLPSNVTMEIPQREVGGDIHYATQFYYDRDTTLTAVWSNDLEINFRWEYFGEYMARQPQEGKITRSYKGYTFSYNENLNVRQVIGDDPNDPIIPLGYCSYYCDVTHMEIQLDDGVDNLPPLGEIVTDPITGEKWRRIPIEDNQLCRIINHPGENNLTPGEHTFEVRARDIQGAVDPEPAQIHFNLPEIPDQSEKVLLVNNTSNMFFTDVSLINNYYGQLVKEAFSSVVDSTMIDTLEILDSSDPIKILNKTIGHAQATYFALSNILDYKTIVWQSHNSTKYYANTSDNLRTHTDLLNLFMNNGGNIVFSGGTYLYDSQGSSNKFLTDYAGFDSQSYALNKSLFAPLYNLDSVLHGAAGLNGFGDLELTANDDLMWITTFGGFANTTFLTLDNATPILKGVAKESVPNPENYDGYVGSKYTKEPGTTGTAYILGFPLYYINIDDAKLFMNEVIDEIWNQ